MTDTIWIALIAGVPATLTAFAGVLVSLRNGRKHDRLEVKTDEIHVQTNGTLSKLTEQLKTANATIDRMHETMESIVPPKKTKGP